MSQSHLYHSQHYDYPLPDARIAKSPVSPRRHSRLMVVGDMAHTITHARFEDLGQHIKAGDLLVMNNTRVMPSRLWGHKKTGGRVEILIETILDAHSAHARLRLSHARAGLEIVVGHALVTLIEKSHESWRIHSTLPIKTLMDEYGEPPIPPYLNREAVPEDKEHYQTVYAITDGAVAAPTAGLHFDAPLLKALAQQGIEQAFVTLHVGAGTFTPLRSEDIRHHNMHQEWLEVPQSTVDAIARTRARGGKIIAVGTTALRSLETAALHHANHNNPMDGSIISAYQGYSQLYILPGFKFRCVDRLITNFHQPKSTLLVLVSAFIGLEPMKAVYKSALDNGYRFLSYGDGSLLTRMIVK